MTNLRDVLEDMVKEIIHRWEEDKNKLDDDIQYTSIDEVVREVFEEYME